MEDAEGEAATLAHDVEGDVSKGDACGLSFAADTPVTTADGSGTQAIASLHAGDRVLAYDPSTGQASSQPVEHVYVNHDANLVDVTLVSDGTATVQTVPTVSDSKVHDAAVAAHGMRAPPSGADAAQHAGKPAAETIQTTTNHPWLTADHGWLPAGFLRVGERVVRADGGTATVAAVRAVEGVAVMYDLTIGAIHTFLVGNGRYVVHNCPDGDGGSGKGKDKLGSNVSANKNVRQVARENGIHPDRDKEEYRDFVRELEDYKNSTSRGGADNWPMSKLRAFGQWYFQGDAEAWKVFDE